MADAKRQAVGVYIRRGDRFLLSQRGPYARHEPFAWEGTGGEVEQGESFEQAARREAMEELGLEVEMLEEILDAKGVPDSHGTIWHTKVYVGTSKSEPTLNESGVCAGFGWFTIDEIEKLSLASYSRKDFDALKSRG